LSPCKSHQAGKERSPSDRWAALFAVFTHAHDLRDYAPMLIATSATKRCGKTRLLEVLDRLVPRPLFSGHVTAPFLAREIEEHRPTIIFDEYDATLNGDPAQAENLRGHFNNCSSDAPPASARAFRCLAAAGRTAWDRRGQCLEIGVGRQVGQIVFLLARRAPLADEPNLFARHVLLAFVADPLRRPVGDAHADGGEASVQRSLRSLMPGERAPFRLGEHVLSADGEDIGQMPFARAAACGDGEDEFDVARVDLLMTGMPTAQASPRALKA
jgi:hypothetical protein